jgi:hypothetical protein
MCVLNWHWVYRDFVTAVSKVESSGDWMKAIQRCYLDTHGDLLEQLHFKPKGFPTKQSVLERLRGLGRDRFDKLMSSIGNDFERFENRLTSLAERILKILNYTGPKQEVYVIVGLDCTNIYSTNLAGSPVTVLCLEAVDGDYNALELLLAHESHHWTRQQQVSHDIFESSLGERIVSEGLASCFSSEIQPGRDVADYCYVPVKTVEWVRENWSLFESLHEELQDNRLIECLFSRTPVRPLFPGMPPRTGYVYGYMKVRQFLKDANKDAITMSGVPWEVVMGVSF